MSYSRNLLRTISQRGISACAGALFIFSVVALAVLPERAEAIPAFAKKHNAPCTLCHTTWPRLNDFGHKYKVNGYQMIDSADGAETGKISPTFDLHLDTGKANPPLSFRLNGGLTVMGPRTGPDGPLANNFPCCMDGNDAGLYVAGTADKDVGYFASYQLGQGELQQGYIRFVNFFGPGYMGLDLGGFRTTDSDAVSPNREWFDSVNPAFFGTGNPFSGSQGVALGYVDSGFRFFGNPNFGPVSYDLVIGSGSRMMGRTTSTRGTLFSMMGRVDIGGFAGSFRYWNNKSGELSFDPTGSGVYMPSFSQTAATGGFAPNRYAPDERTQDYLFAVNYRAERWELELAYDLNNFTTGERTDTAGNILSQGQRNRTGLAVGYIYRTNPYLNLGMRYGVSTVKGYDQIYNGVTTSIPTARASGLDLKAEFIPVQNARVSFQWTIDTSDAAGRTGLDGTVYDAQSRFSLLWDWAI